MTYGSRDLLREDCICCYQRITLFQIPVVSPCKISDTAANKVYNSQCQTNTTKLANLFHQKFGHPNKHVLKSILSSLSFDCLSISAPDFCDVCQYGKVHQMPFYSTGIRTKAPLELIHADLWGPAPLPYLHGYRYYISFVDDCSRYCWIFH